MELRRAPTTGLELAIELRSTNNLIRLWGYVDYSLGVTKLDKDFSSNSMRIGLDVFVDIIQLQNYRIAAQMFTTLHGIKLEKDPKESSESNDIQELNFNVLYVGTGLSLIW